MGRLHDDLVRFWNESTDYYAVNSEMNESAGESHPGHVRIARFLQASGARSVLDVGCGTGHVASVLADLAPEIAYTGIDAADAAVRGAEALGRPGTFVVGDTAELPFPSDSFDAVISLYALEHFTEPERSLREMARVAAPSSAIAILSMNYDRPLGTVASMRFGMKTKPRTHPLNVAVYAMNRARHMLRQSMKHVRYALSPSYVSFQLVDRPLVLEGEYDVDFDAVHVVSGRSVLRVLEDEGYSIVESNVPMRLVSRRPVGLEVFARR